MKNKLLLTLLLALTIVIGSVSAQGEDIDRKERMEALKISFITKHLSLTPEEAKVFWPVFNAWEAEKLALRKEFRDQTKEKRRSINELSDAEAAQLIDSEIEYKEKDLATTKRFITEFKKVISVKKTAILLTLENKFKKYIWDMSKGRPSPER